ncbi:polysaccharide deacetylase family protein [Mucilaginibacter psychrotolerans]|uniref:Uncharacterized protein n=1 Tax=Mucilaginibacter psychrotolerans TaxID=1524096 RepID=A0A4Y8SGP4_9SPHI|nr:hypothetical protein [Mucilaginibacter psychrotolerans]TFF38219.1 hypothetical protein E2R66_09280 [Mucilaginibacter psychrotolerans]
MISVLKKILTKTRHEARYLWGNAKHLMGIDAARFIKARGSRTLVYHGICQKEPLKYLESLSKKPVNSLAFPYGSYQEKNVPLFTTIGYTQLLATDFKHTDNRAAPTMRERLTINPFISITNQMNANIKSTY